MVVLLSVGGLAADFVLNVVLVRLLGAEDYGDYAVGVIVLTVGANIALLGAERSITRFLPEYLRREDFAAGVGYLKFFAPIGVLVALAVAALADFAHPVGALGMLLHDGTDLPGPCIVALWLVPLLAMTRLSARVLRSFLMFGFATVPAKIGVPLLVLLGVLAMRAGHVPVTEARVLLLLGAAYLVPLGIGIAAIPRSFRHRFREPARYAVRDWMALSLPMMLTGLLTVSMYQVDILMLELLSPHEASVGLYAAASKLARLLALPMTAAMVVVPPLIGRLAGTEREAEERRRLFQWGSLVVLVLSVTLVAPVLAAPHTVLAVFGPGFDAAADALVPLALAVTMMASQALSIPFLQFAGRARQVLWLTAAAVAANAGLDLVLIPAYDRLGAALASLAAYGTYSLAVTALAVYRLDLLPRRRSPGRIPAA